MNKVFVVFVVFSFTVFCQDYDIKIHAVDQATLPNLRIIDKTFKNKKEVTKALAKFNQRHIKKGHVLASVDSINWTENTADVYYYLGPAFNAIRITTDENYSYILRKIPQVNEKQLKKTPFQPREVEKLLRLVTDYLQNHGYPYGKAWLTISTINPDDPEATLHIDKGPEVRVNNVYIKGESKLSEQFVTNFISIKEGDDYDESKMRRITQRIDQIQFIDEIKPHELLFTPDGADLYLYLKSTPVSLVNGIVGLQPDPLTGDNIITGDVRLRLQNVLNRGEQLNLNWRSLQPQTQDLKVNTNYPFLFNSPFGVDVRFDLYRRDSTFLTTQAELGAQYFMRGGNYLKVFFEAENSNLLSGASSGAVLPGTSNLPSTNFSAVSSNRYGVGLFRKQVDYLPNPSKGFHVAVDAMVGRRQSRRQDADSSEVNTTYSLRMDLEWFIPLARRHVVRLGNRTRFYHAPEIFVNELYRFGGLTTQRGFDEEELFASSLSTVSVEYRFLVDQNSHAFLFFDQSWYENKSDGYYNDLPYGFGAGFSFGTAIGIFSISYANGKQFDNPILLSNGKVHFGYVSYF